MRCAHCRARDVDVAHVRECSGIQFNERLNDSTGLVKVKEEPMWPASDAQVAYVEGLQRERTLPSEYVVKTEREIRLMEKDEVSRLIGELKVLPYKVPNGNGQPNYDMPSGRYALQATPGSDLWMFFQVDKPVRGRWKGYTFIKRLVGAPGDYKKIDMPASDRGQILGRIQANIERAMTDYGLQSGVCGRCSSPLTDPQSLARGIGPICIGKLGW